MELMFWVAWMIGFGVLVAFLAKRKNRSPWTWGLAGAVFTIPTLLILAFFPYRCPQCRKSLSQRQWRDRTCPRCGDLRPAKQVPKPPPRTVTEQHAQPEIPEGHDRWTGGTDPSAALRKLKELRDAGLISDTEYEAKREEVLGRI